MSRVPRISEGCKAKVITLSDGRECHIVNIPKLKMITITDCRNFAANWIEVDYFNRVYSTRFLSGQDEDLNCALARRFAQCIIEKTSSGFKGDLPEIRPQKLLFNISVREATPLIVREIGKHI